MIILVAVVSYSLKGVFEAKFYLTASLLKVLSIINLALLEFGISPAIGEMEAILQIGIIVEITLLTFALARRYSYFKDYSYKLVVDAQENERYAISQELHDGICGNLVAVKNKLHQMSYLLKDLDEKQKQDIDDTIAIISNACTDVRSISHNIDPDYIKKHRLYKSLQNMYSW
jgi:signal transduction histidine kinase